MALLPVCLLGLCGMVVFVAAGLFLFRALKHTPTARPKDDDVFLMQARENLLPWDSDPLEDLAACWQGQWNIASGVGMRGWARGAVKSLGQPEAEGYLAFSLDRPEAKIAHLSIWTSNEEIAMEFHLEKTFPIHGEALIRVNNQTFGRIHIPEGELFDATGNPAGGYKRSATVIHSARRVPDSYRPVTMHDRTIAELTSVWMRQPYRFRGRYYRAITPLPAPWPALRHIRAGLDPDETTWLLAVIGLELFYNATMQGDNW
ncbi:MAG: hypothetical protein D6803_08450 [Anaerolineae bacterium]|nr:MAG: hypothetical protein D6803_08450 [Anaerolineae bacterium]